MLQEHFVKMSLQSRKYQHKVINIKKHLFNILNTISPHLIFLYDTCYSPHLIPLTTPNFFSSKGGRFPWFCSHASNNCWQDDLSQGFLNYGLRPQMGSPKIILGSRNKLAFCALYRKTLKIPVVPRNFRKKLWLLHM